MSWRERNPSRTSGQCRCIPPAGTACGVGRPSGYLESLGTVRPRILAPKLVGRASNCGEKSVGFRLNLDANQLQCSGHTCFRDRLRCPRRFRRHAARGASPGRWFHTLHLRPDRRQRITVCNALKVRVLLRRAQHRRRGPARPSAARARAPSAAHMPAVESRLLYLDHLAECGRDLFRVACERDFHRSSRSERLARVPDR